LLTLVDHGPSGPWFFLILRRLSLSTLPVLRSIRDPVRCLASAVTPQAGAID